MKTIATALVLLAGLAALPNCVATSTPTNEEVNRETETDALATTTWACTTRCYPDDASMSYSTLKYSSCAATSFTAEQLDAEDACMAVYGGAVAVGTSCTNTGFPCIVSDVDASPIGATPVDAAAPDSGTVTPADGGPVAKDAGLLTPVPTATATPVSAPIAD